MNKTRRKVLFFSLAILLIGIGLITFLFFKKSPVDEAETSKANVVSGKQNNEQENIEETTIDSTNNETNNEDEIEEGTAEFVKKNEKSKYFMDGTREKTEIKKDNYAYLLSGKPIEFNPKLPTEWENIRTQIDEIPGFYEMEPSERAVYYKEKTNFTLAETKELQKIKDINSKMYEAYQKGDYNTYLANMYKGWREYYGVFIGKIIKSGEYKEKVLGFYPEKIDTKIGYAYGFMVKEISYFYNGSVTERRVVDSFIMYKQNDAGNWEVYYDYQME